MPQGRLRSLFRVLYQSVQAGIPDGTMYIHPHYPPVNSTRRSCLRASWQPVTSIGCSRLCPNYLFYRLTCFGIRFLKPLNHNSYRVTKMRRRRSSESYERRRRRRDSEDSYKRHKRHRAAVEREPTEKSRKEEVKAEPVVLQVRPNWMDEISEHSESEASEEDAARLEAERRKRMERLANKYTAEPKKLIEKTVEQPKEQPEEEPEQKCEKPHAGKEFDMFGEDEAHPVIDSMNMAIDDAGEENLLLTDNWTDKDGYYAFKTGEALDKKYQVEGKLGSGVFSIVLKARDTHTKQSVAIKVVRANETMTKTALKELDILKLLATNDPSGSQHCIRMLDSFSHRNHICLVLEPMDCNLREIVMKYGKKAGSMVGLSLKAVKSFTRQLAVCLKYLVACSILHADFKPDNILVDSSHQVVKLSDFGSGMMSSEVEITPYLVSRFYRSPEVILGLPYGHAMDMWSLGVTVYELYTGKMLFPGSSNNQMLHLQQEVRGAFPKKLVRQAAFKDKYYNDDLVFIHMETDPVTKKPKERTKTYFQPVRPVRSLLEDTAKAPQSSSEEKQQINELADFISRATVLNPKLRMTPDEALHHPFIA